MLRLLPKILVPLALFYALSACEKRPRVVFVTPTAEQWGACKLACVKAGGHLFDVDSASGDCLCSGPSAGELPE